MPVGGRGGTTMRHAAAAVGLGVWLGASVASAEVRLGAPVGWGDPVAGASARAQSWAEATGSRAAQTWSPGVEDDFAETLAVLARETPVDAAVLDDPAAGADALAAAVAPIVGDESPKEFAVVSVGDDVPVLRGRWDTKGIAYHVALVSSGTDSALVIMAVRADENSLYEAVFDNAIENVRGAAEPVYRFPRQRWRLFAIFGWLIAAGLTWLGISLGADRKGDHKRTGQKVAQLLPLVALLVGVILFFVLGGEEAGLRLAGVSREWMAAELAGIGLLFAALALGAGMVLGRSRVVQSAPEGGTFADPRRKANLPQLYDPKSAEIPKVAPVDAAPSGGIDLPSVGAAAVQHNDGGTAGEAAAPQAQIRADGSMDQTRPRLDELPRDSTPANLVSARDSDPNAPQGPALDPGIPLIPVAEDSPVPGTSAQE